MSDGGRDRTSLGAGVWKSSQKLIAQRSAVRSIAWLDAELSLGFRNGLDQLRLRDRSIGINRQSICDVQQLLNLRAPTGHSSG